MSLKPYLISPIWPPQAHIWEPKAELVSQSVNLSVQSMVNVHPAIHHTTHQIPPEHCGRSTAYFLLAIRSIPKFLFKMSRFKQKERSPDLSKYVSSARDEGCLPNNWNINFPKKKFDNIRIQEDFDIWLWHLRPRNHPSFKIHLVNNSSYGRKI